MEYRPSPLMTVAAGSRAPPDLMGAHERSMGSGDEGAPGKGKRPARFADHGKARARRPRIDDNTPNQGGYEEEKEGDRRRRRRQREDTQFSDDENMVTADEGEEEEEEDEEVARQLGPRSEIKKRKQLNPAGTSSLCRGPLLHMA
jgi:hypothetical protein